MHNQSKPIMARYMTSRLDTLRNKLRAREGIPGYEKNCQVLKAEIARLETKPVFDDQTKAPKKTAKGKRYRSAESGQFVKREVAEENPATTVSETIKPVASKSSEG